MEFIRALGELPAFWDLFDPGWWNVMLDTTTSGHYSPEATILTLGVFAAAGLSIALGLVVKIRFTHDEPMAIDRIVKPAEIRGLLETALTQRSKMRVSFVRDDPGTRSTDATILSVDRSKGIELEMTTLVRANQSWVGKLVACDFRLRIDPRKDYENFFGFVVPILRIVKAGDDYIHMTVEWPTRLDLEQKRAFLRVEPSRFSILTLALWHENMVRGSSGHFGDPSTWGKPLVTFDASAPVSVVEMRNISAGGLRLEIKAEAIRHQPDTLFEPGSRFLMHLTLAEPEAEHPLEFFLALRLQNAYGDPEVFGNKAYGFRILSFGAPAQTPLETLTWKTAVAGVPAIDDWAFRRHLEVYRARGGS